MRQNLKLEKEAALKSLNNSKNLKETISPKTTLRTNTQFLNFNPYGIDASVNKPVLQSNFIYNIVKKEKAITDKQKKSSFYNEIHDAKYK